MVAAFALSGSGGGSPAVAAGPCPDAGACVVVDVVGSISASRIFTAADLAAIEDLTSPAYEIRSAPGGPTQSEPRPNQAVSIQRLLTSIEVAPGSTLPWQSVTFTEVPDRNGTPRTLSNTQLANAGANGFANGLMPAVFVVGANDAMAYIRPLRPDGDDVNVTDFFQSLSGGALQITAHTTGRLLAPRVVAGTTTLATGQADAFSVTFDEEPGTDVTYSWNFGDGSGAEGRTPSHAYTGPGTYGVSVTVRGADGSYGRSGDVLIQVGPAPTPTAGPSPGTGTTPTKGPPTGPSKPTPTSGPGPTKAPSGAPTTAATGTPRPTATAAPTTSTPAPTPSAQPSRTSSPKPGPRPKDEIEGILLAAGVRADTLPVTPPTRVDKQAARRATQPPRHIAWWVLSLPLLLLIGAAGESRALPRLWARINERKPR